MWQIQITAEYFIIFSFGVLALFFSEAGNGLARDYYEVRAGRPGFARSLQPEQLVLKGAWGSHLLAFLFVLLIAMRLGFEGWRIVALSAIGFGAGYYAHADPFFWDRRMGGGFISAISVTWVPFWIACFAFNIAPNLLKINTIVSFYLATVVLKEWHRKGSGNRYAQAPFPAYAYLPGHTPHPRRDAGGHAYGQPEPQGSLTNPNAWPQTPLYLEAIDLFNAGYYWEAHEAWEALWKVLPAHEDHARFLQSLIQLSAASLKYRLNHPEGVHRLFVQAIEKLQDLSKRHTTYMGIDLRRLIQQATGTFTVVQFVKTGETLPKFRPMRLRLQG